MRAIWFVMRLTTKLVIYPRKEGVHNSLYSVFLVVEIGSRNIRLELETVHRCSFHYHSDHLLPVDRPVSLQREQQANCI